MVAGFILATLFSAAVTVGTGYINTNHQSRMTERSARVNELAKPAEAFDPLVSAYVAEINRSSVTTQTRDDIRSNLKAQRAALENLKGLSSPAEKQLAGKYEEALGRADAGIKTGTGPLNSKQFMQAAADIAFYRAQLLEDARA